MRETIPAALAGERLDRVVAMLTGMTRAEVADLVDSGGVRLNARPARVRSRRVAKRALQAPLYAGRVGGDKGEPGRHVRGDHPAPIVDPRDGTDLAGRRKSIHRLF